VAPLLDQIDNQIGQVTADGAPTYETIAAHGEEIEAVIPPRSTVVASDGPGPPTQRDRHLAMIAERGRLAWQAATGYGRRSLAETTMRRYKSGVRHRTGRIARMRDKVLAQLKNSGSHYDSVASLTIVPVEL
jgi:hypothetical protein